MTAATPIRPIEERPARCTDCGIPLLAMYVSETDRSRCAQCVGLERNAEEVARYVREEEARMP